MPSRRKLHIVLLLALCVVAFFWALGSVGPFDQNEAIYAQVAREMYLRSDWITPRMNGWPWYDKPPLALWCAIVSYHIFGISGFAARLPVALAATGVVFLTYWFGARYLTERAGFLAGTMVALNPLFLGTARQMTMDIHQALWFSVALVCFFLGYTASVPRGKRWYYGLWAACGLSFLAKSAPGLIPIFIALGFVVIAERFRGRAILSRVWESKLWIGIPLLFVIILPWHVLMYRAHGHVFLQEYFFHHNVQILNGKDFGHAGPFWYYVPGLLVSFFPWSVFLPWALISSVQACRGSGVQTGPATDGPPGPGTEQSASGGWTNWPVRRGAEGAVIASAAVQASARDSADRGGLIRRAPIGSSDSPSFAADPVPDPNRAAARLLVLLWAVVVFVLFSGMVSKLISYLIPMFPAAALLVGDWMDRQMESRRISRAWGLRIGSTAVAVLVIACAGALIWALQRYAGTRLEAKLYEAIPPGVVRFVLEVLVVCAAGSSVAAGLVWYRRSRAGIYALVGTMAAFCAMTVALGIPALERGMNAPLHSLAMEAAREMAAGLPVMVYIASPARPSVLFYMPERTFERNPVRGRDDLGLVWTSGLKEDADRFLASHRPACILTDTKRADELLASVPGLTVLGKCDRWRLLRAAARPEKSVAPSPPGNATGIGTPPGVLGE